MVLLQGQWKVRRLRARGGGRRRPDPIPFPHQRWGVRWGDRVGGRRSTRGRTRGGGSAYGLGRQGLGGRRRRVGLKPWKRSLPGGLNPHPWLRLAIFKIVFRVSISNV